MNTQQERATEEHTLQAVVKSVLEKKRFSKSVQAKLKTHPDVAYLIEQVPGMNILNAQHDRTTVGRDTKDILIVGYPTKKNDFCISNRQDCTIVQQFREKGILLLFQTHYKYGKKAFATHYKAHVLPETKGSIQVQWSKEAHHSLEAEIFKMPFINTKDGMNNKTKHHRQLKDQQTSRLVDAAVQAYKEVLPQYEISHAAIDSYGFHSTHLFQDRITQNIPGAVVTTHVCNDPKFGSNPDQREESSKTHKHMEAEMKKHPQQFDNVELHAKSLETFLEEFYQIHGYIPYIIDFDGCKNYNVANIEELILKPWKEEYDEKSKNDPRYPSSRFLRLTGCIRNIGINVRSSLEQMLQKYGTIIPLCNERYQSPDPRGGGAPMTTDIYQIVLNNQQHVSETRFDGASFIATANAVVNKRKVTQNAYDNGRGKRVRFNV